MQYRQVGAVAGKGAGRDQFTGAVRALTVDRNDHLFAAGDSHVLVFDPSGKLRTRWSTSKPAHAIAVARDGSALAGEEGQVEIFRPGRPAEVWHDPRNLGLVTAIGFAGEQVLIGDAHDRCIRRYDGARKLLGAIGQDNRTNGFLIPNGVLDFAVDPAGVIHAANPGKHRVERYSASGVLSGHIGRFDEHDPAGFTGCCNPTNIALGKGGTVYLTEKAGPRAKVLDAGGNLVAVIATAAFDAAAKNMSIAVDSRGRVYVADTVTLRILVFERVS